MTRRICKTHSLKKKQKFSKHAIYKASQLFNGTVHFLNINFGGATVTSDDYKTAVTYTSLAMVPISQYCGQYGPNSLTIDQVIYTAAMPSTTYNDADLQRVIEQFTGFPDTDCIIVLSPAGATNTDAPLSQGVLGYHGNTGKHPYIVVNLEGAGLTVDDQNDVYADALSHELAEMVVDPAADLSNPEVCDPCAGNCGVDYRNYFDSQGKYLGGSPVQGYAFWTNGIATPATVAQCPSPSSGCVYDPANPPISPAPNPPSPCIAELQKGLDEILIGQITTGVDDLLNGILCLFTGGYLTRGDVEKLEGRLQHARRPEPVAQRLEQEKSIN